MNETDLPDTTLVLLKAIAYPDFARPEYFLREQEKSSWSKPTYLRALLHAYWALDEKLRITDQIERSKLRQKAKKGEVTETAARDFKGAELDLSAETGGKVTGKLNQDIMIDLEHAINLAWRKDAPQKTFTGFQVLAFCERALLFIKDQYEKQTHNIHPTNFGLDPRFATQQPEAEVIHTVYHYWVISDAPFLDFHVYRNEIRSLLLNSHNPEKLRVILKPVMDLAIKIIDLWNEKIQPAEMHTDKEIERPVRESITVEFEETDLSVSYKTDIPQNKYVLNTGRHYMNQDLAVFAAKVANLIAGEVLERGSKITLKGEYFDFSEKELLNEVIALLKERPTIVQKEKDALLLVLEQIREGRYSIITVRSLIPSIEQVIRQALITKGKLPASDTGATLHNLVEMLRKALNEEIIFNSDTIHMLESMERNKLLHGNLNPEGPSLKLSLGIVLNALLGILRDWK